MKCSKCGQDLGKNDLFCDQCGQKVSKKAICPKCGHENSSKSIFCVKCGASLDADTDQTKGKRKQVRPRDNSSPAKEERGSSTSSGSSPTIIIKQDQKKQSNWALWILVGILASMLICVALIWFDVVDLPESVINRLPDSIQQIILNIEHDRENGENGKDGENGENGNDGNVEDGLAIVVDPSTFCDLFSDVPISIVNPEYKDGNSVFGRLVFVWPPELIMIEGNARIFKVYHKDDPNTIYEVVLTTQAYHNTQITGGYTGCHVETPGAQPDQFFCLIERIPRVGELPAGTYTYEFSRQVFKEGEWPENPVCRIEEFLEYSITVAEEPVDKCAFDAADSFANSKINYWFAPNNKDLFISITNDMSLLLPSYSVNLSREGSAPVTAMCMVSPNNPARMDCLFPNFPGPSGSWGVEIEFDGCPLYDTTIDIIVPSLLKCPVGETWHEGFLHNNGCCTDGCWCTINGYTGCWVDCAPHCSD